MPPLDDMPDNATCPRCGATFHCGAHDAVSCHCSTVPLDASTLQWLRERYTGCLCVNCLRALGTAAATMPTGASPPDTAQ